MKIELKYDGEYPNLCSGILTATINGEKWVFPKYCMKSGGGVWFDVNWSEHVEGGPWEIRDWPDGFPEELKDIFLEEVNAQISHGCCGGCV